MRKRIDVLRTALVLGAVQACELPEITVPPGGTIVIVQGLVRPDRIQQWLLVEESYNGTQSNLDAGGPIPSPGSSATPVSGAVVTVSNRASRTLACRSATYLESAAPDNVIDGAYWAPPGCPTMAPGDTLDLTVTTNGESLSASTVLPAVTRMTLSTGQSSMELPGPAFIFNRDLDTLQASVESGTGRAIHVTLRTSHPDGTVTIGNRSDADAWFWVDSNEIRLPGNILDLLDLEFEDGVETLELFVAGTTYEIAVAFMEENFYDALRSGNSPLSGRGFINSIDGGYGFFGGMVVESNALRVIGNQADAREGRYRATGVVDGVNVNLDLDLYLGEACTQALGECVLPPLGDPTLRWSAFTTGQWALGPIDQSLVGRINRDNLGFLVQQNTGNSDFQGFPEVRVWIIRGDIPVTGPQTMDVLSEDETLAGSVVLEKMP
jgi:hypothetical protein